MDATTQREGSTPTVVVGMSGGVDSSVAALLLRQQGWRVIGVFMRNWEEEDDQGACTATEDFNDVVAVCDQIGIPYYTVNFAREYWDQVFARCLEEFRAGLTPNPDILCNREIKFKALLKKALDLGADYLATGHYCRNPEVGGRRCLAKGTDPNKDQSYFLYTLKEKVLDKVLFPIGGLTKGEVRHLAREHGLSTAEKKDSTGICFIGERKFKSFLSHYLPCQTGNIETSEGKVVGTHDGVAFYTIGQRKGLRLGGAVKPWFVVGKDVARNVLIVDQGSESPSLFQQEVTATELSWVHDTPPELPHRCHAKIRYRQQDTPCCIQALTDGKLAVRFDEPQRAVTPRQSIVFYEGELCLGGGLLV